MADMRAVLGEEEYLRICHNHDCGSFVEGGEPGWSYKRYQCGRVDRTRRNTRPGLQLPELKGGAVTNPQRAYVSAPDIHIPVNVGPPGSTATAKMSEAQVKRFAAADALERAWRTFKTGIGLDIGVAVVLVLVPAFTNVQWTPVYWATLASVLGKSVLQAVASYYYRKWVTPKVGVRVKS